MTGCTVSGNTWGGINNYRDGELTMINSTVSGNFDGSAISNSETMTMTNCTVARNGAEDDIDSFSGVGNRRGTLTITGSVIEGKCFGAITSGGYNIESPGDTCSFDPNGTDLINVTEEELNLGPLADHGGPTMTHEPGDGGFGSGSVAIDAIPEAECGVVTDQRGEPRPEPGSAFCDAGAFERQPDDP